ncbi:maltokinase N-terminal cap-like domain-containing protein [Leifsonia poae]|uniref:maltokinase N-terminal cap-like domain-containing protein n=1 Tax=Leifsonia poae TaxID=110933 RepID=UPI001CC0C312|nr:phosphotransferase [Leifsonia poae]
MTELTELVGSWMRRQRWYSTKNVEPRLRLLGSFEAEPASDQARVITHFFADDGPRLPRVYQVPVVARVHRDGDPTALIGEAGGRSLYDGPADEAYVSSLLELIAGGAPTRGGDASARGHRIGDPVRLRSSRRLTGEQSNSAVVAELDGGDLALVKVFRVVHDGANPDVSTLAALTAGAFRHTPSLLGWVSGSWPDSAGDAPASGDLALVQTFLTGAEDGWELAVRAAETGDDFGALAFDLGVGTAELHAQLGRLLPTREADRDDVARALDGMLQRLTIASAEVPEIAGSRADIVAVYTHAAEASRPRLQRIHGDLHLGQVLLSPGRGWQFIDFEGEPLRPLAERSRPDLPVRDVAGMLRSFDYVAGSLARREPPVDAVAWAARARQSFLQGYASGDSVHGDELGDGAGRASADDAAALLDAFELDKAVYEVTYESRHRPAWVPIPLAAVHRLLAARV